jgi:transcriptional regulator with XRE-family HTH domain
MSTDPPPVILERAVEDRRLELGLQKQEVAEKARVTASYLRRVLSGKNPLSPDLKAGLERALDWPRGYIDSLRPPSDTDSPPPGSRYTQEEWDRLDASDRQLLLDIHRKLNDHQNHPIQRRKVAR